ncbi:hypothetical protein [Alcanivorax sp.]|uniref:hypothetical protein n=1 Tax=Alcanivorax sp. TaxID=1872427 RepID=UPI0025C188FD|nr:hypothetical protein [Alcanivorax sp.]
MSEYVKLVRRLESDLEEVGDLLLKNKGNEALECSYIRALFSTLEGILFAFRIEVVESDKFKLIFDLPSQAKILEKKLDPNNYCITKKTRYLTFKQAVKYSCRSLARVKGKNPDDLPFKGPDWSNVLEANKIRDRITHPKSVDDLVIGNDGLEVVMKAKAWLREEVFSKLVE